jgi:ATP-dependent RNA helicase RhlE
VSFQPLGLIEPILQALQQQGYTHPTPIQEKAIPAILQQRDLLGCAQTGTGKTAAFVLPVLQLMQVETPSAAKRRPIRTLILTPTRELALQIGENIAAYGANLPLNHLVIFGGVGQNPQVEALRRGVDILVATPGRLLDLMQQGFVQLNEIRYFILDEADRMLDMGFIHDVRKVIAKLPAKRQTLFFSATMPPEIQSLSADLLTDPVKVEVTPVSSTAEMIQQHVYHTNRNNKKDLLIHLLENAEIKSVLVFTQMKHAANRLCEQLSKSGIRAEAIHGNKSQSARVQALENFKNRRTRVLVATDIAARGIDIDELSHVVNFDLPNIPETYVHRIGRTGRAGASGVAISLCEPAEKPFLRDIEKLIQKHVPVISEHPYPVDPNAPVEVAAALQRVPHGGRQQRPARNQQQRTKSNNSTRTEARGPRPNDRPQQRSNAPRNQGQHTEGRNQQVESRDSSSVMAGQRPSGSRNDFQNRPAKPNGPRPTTPSRKQNRVMDMPKPNPIKQQTSTDQARTGNPNAPWNQKNYDDQVDRW